MGWRGTSLQVAADADFQRRDWRLQRVAWVVFAAILIVAVLGLFGSGPVSWAEERSSSGELVVRYERFSRKLGETSLNASIRPDPRTATVALVVSPGYLDANEIRSVTPAPTAVVFTSDGVRYEFAVDDRSGPVEVEFHVKPKDIGVQHFALSLPGAEPVAFWQLMYP